MKGAAIVALVLVAGALLAHLLLTDPGYVAIRLGRTLFETTLPVFVLLLGGVHLVAIAATRAFASRRRIAQLRAERRRRKARDDTQRGLLDLAAGQWKSAEELLSRAAPEADSAAANYLIAARAADLLDAVDRRDEWLARAQDEAPEARVAALITLAEMQMRRGQDEAALRTLEQLDASGDLNPRGLELMARLCQKLGRNERLTELGPRLLGARELPADQVNELLAHVRLAEIRAAGERANQSALEKAWSELPRAVRKLPQSIVTYARSAMACQDHPSAERALRELIEESGDTAAIRLYGDLALPDPLVPLERAENWLRQRPEHADLLATCARLSLRAELFGKARSYLEASLARRPTAENSLILAELLEDLGEHEAATTWLKRAAQQAVGRRSNLPRVRLRRY
jgi:HemY protein